MRSYDGYGDTNIAARLTAGDKASLGNINCYNSTEPKINLPEPKFELIFVPILCLPVLIPLGLVVLFSIG